MHKVYAVQYTVCGKESVFKFMLGNTTHKGLIGWVDGLLPCRVSICSMRNSLLFFA